MLHHYHGTPCFAGNVAKVKELLATMKREYNVAPRRWETVALIEAYCAAGM